jgi:hypothetical protein
MRIYFLGLALAVAVGSMQTTALGQTGAAMTRHASGEFDLKMSPQKDEGIGDPTVGRMSIVKTHHGDLEGPAWGRCSRAWRRFAGLKPCATDD